MVGFSHLGSTATLLISHALKFVATIIIFMIVGSQLLLLRSLNFVCWLRGPEFVCWGSIGICWDNYCVYGVGVLTSLVGNSWLCCWLVGELQLCLVGGISICGRSQHHGLGILCFLNDYCFLFIGAWQWIAEMLYAFCDGFACMRYCVCDLPLCLHIFVVQQQDCFLLLVVAILGLQ